MFADLGHFSVKSIQVHSAVGNLHLYRFSLTKASYYNLTTPVQIAFTCVVFPCLLLAYMGQAAYLMQHPDAASRIFYNSVPGDIFRPYGRLLFSVLCVVL